MTTTTKTKNTGSTRNQNKYNQSRKPNEQLVVRQSDSGESDKRTVGSCAVKPNSKHTHNVTKKTNKHTNKLMHSQCVFKQLLNATATSNRDENLHKRTRHTHDKSHLPAATMQCHHQHSKSCSPPGVCVVVWTIFGVTKNRSTKPV